MSIFDRFRSKKTAQPNQSLAMVLLRSAERPSVDAVFSYLRANWPDFPSITDIQTDGPVATARIPGGSLSVLHVPAPIPGGDLEGPMAVAWHWPGARADIELHRSHLIVFASSISLAQLDLRLLHTQFTAAIVAVCDAIGVYVGDAMMVRSAEDYVEGALQANRDFPPLLLWIGFNPVNDDGLVSAYTTGLSRLGFLELEVHRVSRPVPDVLGTLADIAAYQITSGKTLKDGDTFGSSETERYTVRYQASEFIPDMTVALLGL